MKYQLTEKGRDLAFQFVDLWYGKARIMPLGEVVKKRGELQKREGLETLWEVLMFFVVSGITVIREYETFDGELLERFVVSLGYPHPEWIGTENHLQTFARRGWVVEVTSEVSVCEE